MKSRSSLVLWILFAGVVVAVWFLCHGNGFAVALFVIFIVARLVRDITYFGRLRNKK